MPGKKGRVFVCSLPSKTRGLQIRNIFVTELKYVKLISCINYHAKVSLKVHQVPRKSKPAKENDQYCLTEKSPVDLLFGEKSPPLLQCAPVEGKDVSPEGICVIQPIVPSKIGVCELQHCCRERINRLCVDAVLRYRCSHVPCCTCLLHVHHSGSCC